MSHSVPSHHFSTLAPWSEYRPPLRPSAQDVAVVQRVIDGVSPARAVLLGLTPELAGCRWPSGLEFTAVDHDREMIERLWPPPVCPAGARVLVADWCELPMANGSIDLLVGDGCLTTLTFPGWRRFARSVRRVLSDAGRLALRVFTRPAEPEPIEQIATELAAGQIRDVNALKLRLFAAVHRDGALLADVWRAWDTMRCESRPGFGVPSLAGMERYRGSTARYVIGTESEVGQILGEQFAIVEWHRSTDYELAERCPTLVLEPR